MINASRIQVYDSLRHYGEYKISWKVLFMFPKKYRKLSEIAWNHALTGMYFEKAFSLAAVEVIEGKPRELKRKRRQFKKPKKKKTTKT